MAYRLSILTAKGGRAKLTRSYDRVNSVLHYAPQPWLRHVARRVTLGGGNSSVGEIGTWIYVAYSTCVKGIYAGQTGAIGEPRAIIDRFGEEIRDSAAWEKLYGKKGVRGPLYLRTMHQMGTHNFSVVCIRAVTPREATKAENTEIQLSPRSLNTTKRPRKGYMRWLIRSRLWEGMTNSALRDEKTWERLSTGRPRRLNPMDAITILARARTVLSKPKFLPLQTRLITYIEKKTGLKLPRATMLKIPYATPAMARAAKSAFNNFVHSVP